MMMLMAGRPRAGELVSAVPLIARLVVLVADIEMPRRNVPPEGLAEHVQKSWLGSR
jgi:hypothetical protein